MSASVRLDWSEVELFAAPLHHYIRRGDKGAAPAMLLAPTNGGHGCKVLEKQLTACPDLAGHHLGQIVFRIVVLEPLERLRLHGLTPATDTQWMSAWNLPA